MNKSELISHRSYLPTDKNFILSTWLKGYQGGLKWFRKTPRKTFHDNYKKVIEALMQARTIKVACLKEDPDVIVGYCVYRGDLVDWVYIKEDWRKIGIAKDLLPENFKAVSHLTNIAFEILRKHPEIIYNPFL